ncbi:MAG: hypothetical protein ACOX21_04925 [Bacillota bacterium]
MVSAIPWHKFHPRYIIRQLQSLRLGAGAPEFLKRIRDWWQRLVKPRNRL